MIRTLNDEKMFKQTDGDVDISYPKLLVRCVVPTRVLSPVHVVLKLESRSGQVAQRCELSDLAVKMAVDAVQIR